RRANRQLRWALAAVVVLLVFALLGGSLAAVNGRRANQDAAAAERSTADAEKSSANSLAERLASAGQSEPRLDTSLLLARQAVATSDELSLQGNLLHVLANRNVLSSATIGGTVTGRELDTTVSADGSRALVQMVHGDPNSGDSLLLVDP